jgi:hypothetical protein
MMLHGLRESKFPSRAACMVFNRINSKMNDDEIECRALWFHQLELRYRTRMTLIERMFTDLLKSFVNAFHVGKNLFVSGFLPCSSEQG